MEIIIDTEPQCNKITLEDSIKESLNRKESLNTKEPSINKDQLKDQLKQISLSERQQLLNTIIVEERLEYIKQQQQKIQDDEKEYSKCPLSKKIKRMSIEIQELKMDLQKSKHEMNAMKIESQRHSYSKKNKCPFSLGTVCALDTTLLNTNLYSTNEDENLDKFCEELTETYTSSFSWWFTIMFIVFMLFILTSKPLKPFKPINLCDSLFL